MLIDQDARDFFAEEVQKNFSVIAPAGVGKTYAITQRILQLAKTQDQSSEALLSSLVVVTYTNKAALEIQQRAREAIISTRLSSRTMRCFNQAFFGTIHGFCVKLLKQFGFQVGLPATFEVVQNDEKLWHEFLQKGLSCEAVLNGQDVSNALRLVGLDEILPLARYVQVGDSNPPEALNFDGLRGLEALVENGPGAKNVIKSKALAKSWYVKWKQHDGYVGLPAPYGTSKKLLEEWNDAFGGLSKQAGLILLPVVWQLSEQYQQFRVRKGALKYEDQIALAKRLLRKPFVRAKVREMECRVILDEAQDTDPQQFDLLLELARDEQGQFRQGSFVMVGDPQQSIYSSRANLEIYKRAHKLVCRAGESVTFEVTFRCDEKVVKFVNACFPSLLNGDLGQAAFVPLRERPDPFPGQVVRWAFPMDQIQAQKLNQERCRFLEAQWLAKQLVVSGLEKLQASSWSQVAILCPRRAWLEPVAQALQAEGLKVDLHSASRVRGDSPVMAWFLGLFVSLVYPWRTYEVVGVLRELFGLSDQVLYEFKSQRGEFNYTVKQVKIKGKASKVADALKNLKNLKESSTNLPLGEAVRFAVDQIDLLGRLNAAAAVEKILEEQELVFEGVDIEGELNVLLMQADAAEERGVYLGQWVEELESGFRMEVKEEPRIRDDAIQLITSQKAKGLQWDAVVVPFISANIEVKSEAYPRVMRNPADGMSELVLHPNQMRNDFKAALLNARTQELSRIAYVTMTRAKHTLLLIDDEALFEQTRKRGQNSFHRVMQLDQLEVWEKLSKELVEDKSLELQELQNPHGKVEEVGWEKQVDQARKISWSICKRMLPHELTHSDNPKVEKHFDDYEVEWPIPAEDNPGIQYGTWWHQFVERIQWKEDQASWLLLFDQMKTQTGMVKRAEYEFDLLRKSEIAEILSSQEWVIHHELPFWDLVVIDNEQRCVDGVIDLAAYNLKQKQWIVVDWKTDRVKDVVSLVELYGGQVAAYVQALENLTKVPARGYLYSTVFGEWLKINAQSVNQVVS
ncbi:MAG: UvrD-helicase domain-containing protein [Verrucomicrobiota bacterium]